MKYHKFLKKQQTTVNTIAAFAMKKKQKSQCCASSTPHTPTLGLGEGPKLYIVHVGVARAGTKEDPSMAKNDIHTHCHLWFPAPYVVA